MEIQEIINNEEEQPVQAEVAAIDEQEEPSLQWKDRVKAWITVKRIVLLSVALVLLIAAVVVLSWLGNNWRTPIWRLEHFCNKTSYYPEEYVQWELNGLAEKKLKKYCRILKKGEAYSDWRKDYYENTEVEFEKLKTVYGEDYRLEFQIDDQTELSKKELKQIRLAWQEKLESLAYWLDDVEEEWDSSDWRDFANDYDMEVKAARNLFESCRKVCESFGRIKITDGYDVTITIIITGEDIDDPLEYGDRVRVVKVNGRWVKGDAIDRLYALLHVGNLADAWVEHPALPVAPSAS